MKDERILVYSTDGSLPLPQTPKRKAPAAKAALPDDGVVRVLRERRRASAVTLVHGLAAGEIDALGKELRRLCGTGGTTKNGVVRVLRERRRASAVTLVHGLAAGEIDALGKELRRLCGTGGTTKNGVVELQGDHRDKVVAYFEKQGRRVKKAGG